MRIPRPSRRTPAWWDRATDGIWGALLVGIVPLILIAIAVTLWQTVGPGHHEDQPLADPECTHAPAAHATARHFAGPPSPSLAGGRLWQAVLQTNCGRVEIELDGLDAPQTVSSFVFLARHGYWRDSPCHRITTAPTGMFILQCGDPTGTGLGDPGYSFGIENAPTSGHYPRGTVAMARADDPNSNGSQFFFVYQDTDLPTAGGGYSIFGKVTGGMDILDAIAAQGAEDGQHDYHPFVPFGITSVRVARIG